MNARGERTGVRRIVVAVALMSAASLGYEILLMRVFSIMYWHHFAHLIISMALLGAGASGAVLALVQDRLLPRFHLAYTVGSALFALTIPMSVAAAGWLPFNPPELIWDHRQIFRMVAVFLPAALPFFFSGGCIGLAIRHQTEGVGRIYRADLGGASLGALVLTLLLFCLRPDTALRVIALAGACSGVLIGGRGQRVRWGVPALAAAVALLWPAAGLAPVHSHFKDMSRLLLIPGVRTVAERHSPVGVFSALETALIPFRSAPGLSMLAPVEPPEQVALFLDGHSAGMVHGAAGGTDAAMFMRWTPMALPYVLVPAPDRVLVAGAGGGGDVLHAILEEALRVDAVEQHRELIELARGPLGAFSGHVYANKRVRVIHGDVRGFLAASAGTGAYDLIQISPLGTAAPPSAGAGQALLAQYLYTVEGMRQALSCLSARGVLAISMDLEMPPRGTAKLLQTLAEAMRREGFVQPQAHTAVVRAWNTVTVLCSRPPLTGGQMETVRDFCRTRSFDVAWLPDIAASEVNRVNILERPFFHEAALDAWQGRMPIRDRFFQLAPATDDRPWFGHYFRWRSLPALWAQRAAGGASMLEWETLLLWASLVFAIIVSTVLIGLPLLLLRRRERRQGRDGGLRPAPLVYVAALGLAFLFLEIAFLHQFVLFLRHPMISMAVIVPSFLLFAGGGSGCMERLAAWSAGCRWGWMRDRPVAAAVAGIVLFAGCYLWLLPPLFRVGAGWPDWARIGVSILLISGPAFWMGMPFPLGIRRLGRHSPSSVPLAWGVNGLFSVISATAATAVALHGGFRVVILLAVALYLLAAVLERRF